jgi:hypothetical protein
MNWTLVTVKFDGTTGAVRSVTPPDYSHSSGWIREVVRTPTLVVQEWTGGKVSWYVRLWIYVHQDLQT